MITKRVSEAAQMLQVSTATIRNWINAGTFPGARKANPTLKNSPYRIPVAEIQALMTGQPDQAEQTAKEAI